MLTPELEPLLKKAEALLEKYQTFSISTLIPKAWMASEEQEFDRKLKGAESIKNSLNAKIAKELAAKTKKKYIPDGEVRIVFDFTKESAEPEVRAELQPVFVFGRYKKLVPGLSQSRWLCSECGGKGCAQCNDKGKHYESIEERIGEVLKRHFDASDYSLHASGREDVDARNTAGRPFVMELKEPKKRKAQLGRISKEIGAGKEVEVVDLALVPRSFVEVVTESHFDKEYEAEIEFEKDVGDVELEKIKSLSGKMLEQQTPNRVMHRRADLVRKRKVIELTPVKTQDSKHATFRIMAEAGTYIKELISGDEGRTVPSFAGVLGFGAKCMNLTVTRIDDEFLDTCLKG